MTSAKNFVQSLPRFRSSRRYALTSKNGTRATRCQSTCTMDLVSMDEKVSPYPLIFSTLQYVAERDVPKHTPEKIFPRGPMVDSLRHRPNLSIAAEELDLVQAAERRLLFDKILLLVKHGDEVKEESLHEDEVDCLSGRGIGQALTLSRRMAAFCNGETQLVPELVLVAPLKKVLQTTFLAFPYDTPQHSIRNVRWISHPQILDWTDHETVMTVPETAVQLHREFSGVDYSLLSQGPVTTSSANSREERLLEQADSLLDWLKTRDERVVVISGVAAALNAFSCRMSNHLESLPQEFVGGELRAYGLRYTS